VHAFVVGMLGAAARRGLNRSLCNLAMGLVNQSIIKHEMGLLKSAEGLRNVSQARGVAESWAYRAMCSTE
jgi:hypothetical protein